MAKRKENRVFRLFDTLVDERDELLENTEKLIQSIKPHINYIKINPGNSQTEVDSIIQYEMEVSQLLVDLNLQVLKALKHIVTPELPRGVSDQGCSGNIGNDSAEPVVEVQASEQKFMTNVPQHCLKPNVHNQINHDKLPNVSAPNDSNHCRPSDNELIKIICARCANFDNRTIKDQVQSSSDTESEPTKDVSRIDQENISSFNMRNPSPSPSQLSETELSSTVSSLSYQHPLLHMNLTSPDMPKENHVKGIEALKQNFKEFTEKLAVNESTSSGLQEEHQKSISSLNFQHETPVKKEPSDLADVPPVSPSNNSSTTSFFTMSPTSPNVFEQTVFAKPAKHVPVEGTEKRVNVHNEIKFFDINEVLLMNPNEVPEKLVKTVTNITETVPNNVTNGLDFLENTKQQGLLESMKCEPNIPEHPLPSNTAIKSKSSATALEKLMSKQRRDGHQEVVQKALASMPDIYMMPAEPFKVKKNYFSGSDTSSNSDKNRLKNKKKSHAKNNEPVNAVYDLKRHSLPKEDEICVFSHIDSPSEFYIQIINDYTMESLDQISNQMSEKLRGSNAEFASKEEAFPKLGKYCIGYIIEKNAWFRVAVLDWKLGSNSKEVDVQSVDYGFKASISYKYLRRMIIELADIPMLAVKCYLPYLYPPGSSHSYKINEWPEDSVEVMKSIANFSGVYGGEESVKWFKITLVIHDGHQSAVELIELEGESTNSETFGEYLINFGAAVEITDEYNDPGLAEFLEDIGELENADNVNELILGYDAQDEARICRFTRENGTCYKGKNCNLEHVPLPKGGFTTDQLPIYLRTMDNFEEPVRGDVLQVIITGWVDSCTYLVQLIRNPVKDNGGISMDRDLKHLIAAMNIPKICAKFEPLKVAPAIGQIVLAYHRNSRAWMRAIVRTLQGNEIGDFVSAEVFLADFGEIIDVKIRDLRQITEDFVKLPFQAVQIYLHNFKHNPSCDSKQARKFFDKHLFYKNFVAEFRSSSSPWCVKLTTFKGHEIGAPLLKEELAVRRKQDWHIESGSMLLE